MFWWTPTGAWEIRKWYEKPLWIGPKQVEDKSPENIRACYRFLRSVPYQTEEDRERLFALEVERMLELE